MGTYLPINLRTRRCPMRQATLVWSLWQRLLLPFASAFTRPGHRRFVEWVTALALNVEEHTITQSVVAIERLADWKALESFAEYGAWHRDDLTRALARRIDRAPGRVWHGYRVSAVDDTKSLSGNKLDIVVPLVTLMEWKTRRSSSRPFRPSTNCSVP